MYTNEMSAYLAPNVELVEVMVEAGFVNSETNLEDPSLKPEQDW